MLRSLLTPSACGYIWKPTPPAYTHHFDMFSRCNLQRATTTSLKKLERQNTSSEHWGCCWAAGKSVLNPWQGCWSLSVWDEPRRRPRRCAGFLVSPCAASQLRPACCRQKPALMTALALQRQTSTPLPCDEHAPACACTHANAYVDLIPPHAHTFPHALSFCLPPLCHSLSTYLC
jgi:hypothetical protein